MSTTTKDLVLFENSTLFFDSTSPRVDRKAFVTKEECLKTSISLLHVKRREP